MIAQAYAHTQDAPSLAGPALRAFFEICKNWQCKTEEMMTLLGIGNRSTFFNYKKNPDKAKLRQDTLERISYILNIHAALRILFSNPDSINNWVRKPNTNRFFGGKSAMDKMLGGRVMDIHDVMMFLNARRGGWA
ncbi:MAG: MbcA/ParS/Xre antitoxin family protein [Gammaproteobacteria bacterium]|jgi:hypothetical protein